MEQDQNNFMRRAIALGLEAMKSKQGKPFGAVIVRQGNIVGEGFNTTLSGHDPTAHAEIVAIRDACTRLETDYLDNCHMYTTCEPCPMCLGAIYWSGITSVSFGCSKVDAREYGFDDDRIYAELSQPWKDRSIQSKQMLREEAEKLFNKWEEKTKK